MIKKFHLLKAKIWAKANLNGLIVQLLFITALSAFSWDANASFLSVEKTFSQAVTVSGRVLSSEGEPLPGANIVIRNTNTGTVTNIDGEYILDVPSTETVLVYSFIGYIAQEVVVGNRSVIDIILSMDARQLSEIVVVGYGVQRRANLTGSVANVQGETLTDRPAPNSATLLQGRISGLQVTQPSAEPGRDNPNILIRGRGSFGGSNDPLILIDGVTGSLNNLSSNDIESVTVLKDAASAAIYGARAANGVILVTTKQGQRGRAVINYRTNISQHTATALPDFITNSAEYMEMYNEAAERSGVAFRYDPVEINKYRHATDREQFPNFDFVNHFVQPAFVQNHNISASGGGENNTYNVSFGYLDQNALMPGYKFHRYNALINYRTDLSRAVSVGTIMNMTYKDRKEPPFTGTNMMLSVFAAGPLYGPFLPDGSGRVVSRAYLSEGRNRSPQEYYLMGNQRTQEYNLNSQAFIDIKPFKGFTWSTKAAINYVDEFYKMHQTPYEAYVLQERDASGDYRMFTFGPDILGVTDDYRKSITPTVYSTINYNTIIANDHNLNVLGGYEQIYFRHQGLRARRINTVYPGLTELTGYTAQDQALLNTHPRLPGLPGPSEWAIQSVFGRINYNFRHKYLLEGNIRYDGTSKVSPDYRWGLFPSMSAGWLISEESFIQDNLSWLEQLKIRASYGVLGNQDVGTYLYQDNLVISNIFYPFTGSNLTQGAVINQFRDQSLRWESTQVTNIGVDFDIFRGMLGMSFDWFDKTTYNILASQPVPLSLGLSSPTLNDGKMRNRGIELELNHRNTIGEVSYGANFLISTAKNELLHIRTPSRGNTIREVGYPYDSHFLYVWDGIFQEEDIDNPNVPRHVGNPNPRPGDLKMRDINGDGVVDADDRIVVSGAYPDYSLSFGFNANYRGFTLNAFFQGVQGLKARYNNWGIDPFQQQTPPTTKWRDSWTPENRSNTLPAIYIAGYPGVANYTGSTYYLQDASYLRLKNLVLGYTLPQNISSIIGSNNLSVYVSADNLITWTKFEGGDPERVGVTGNFAQYPQTRILNVGLNVQF